MKKLICVLLAVCLLCSVMAACGGKDGNDPRITIREMLARIMTSRIPALPAAVSTLYGLLIP